MLRSRFTAEGKPTNGEWRKGIYLAQRLLLAVCLGMRSMHSTDEHVSALRALCGRAHGSVAPYVLRTRFERHLFGLTAGVLAGRLPNGLESLDFDYLSNLAAAGRSSWSPLEHDVAVGAGSLFSSFHLSVRYKQLVRRRTRRSNRNVSNGDPGPLRSSTHSVRCLHIDWNVPGFLVHPSCSHSSRVSARVRASLPATF